jgi:acetyl-CoA carboxylase biotin carboxyl carrier protein
MFTSRELEKMIQLISQSPIEEFEYADATTKIVVKKNVPLSQNMKSMSVSEENLESPEASFLPLVSLEEVSTIHEIISPMVGTFYSASGADAAPFVRIGDRVEADTVVCVLEAMKLFNEVTANVSGEITEIVVDEGQFVEYGQLLFRVRPC